MTRNVRSSRTPTAGAPAPRPGALDQAITTALAAGRTTLTDAEAAGVDGRHSPAGMAGGTCPGCRFRFHAGATRCPSRVYLVSGVRAALAAVPAATARRRCRGCQQPVAVQAGAAGSVTCPSCEAQARTGDLFGGVL